MPTTDTFKGGLVRPVLLVDNPALRALARRVAGIDANNRHPGADSFVADKATQLPVTPIPKPSPLVAAPSRNPCADALQVFQGNPASGAFSVSDDSLRYAMVYVFLKPRLFASQFAKPSLGSLGAESLQAATALLVPLAALLDSLATVDGAVAIGCQVDDSQVNAKPIFRVEGFGFRHVARCGEEPLASNEAKISLPLTVGQQAALVLTNDNRENHTAFDCPNADSRVVLYETENTLVVSLGAVKPKHGSNRPVDLEGIRNLNDGQHGSLRRQTEPGAHVVVKQFLDSELPKRASVKRELCSPRRCFIATRKGGVQRDGLRRVRKQFDGGYQFHDSNIEIVG